MHPIERIRSLARASWLDPKTVAVEAADAIGDAYTWMDEAAAVLVARRLLAWHPYCGPLWWVCGEILHSIDPVKASRNVVDRLLDDTTGAALDAFLPDGALPHMVGRISAMDDLQSRRAAGSLASATHLVVGASVLGPTALVSHSPAGDLVAEAHEREIPVWAVAEVATAVDARLWDRLEAQVAGAQARPSALAVTDIWWDDNVTDAPEPCLVSIDSLDWICGPDGAEPPAEAAASAPSTPPDLLDAVGAPAF